MRLNRSLSLSDSGQANDQIYPLTKVVAAIIVPFLLAAFVIIYFFPEQSGSRFAWEIKPTMTAVWMASGYLGGAYFFVRVCFLIAFVAPTLAIAYWPWTLTPLTARVLGGWFGLMGIGGLMMSRERRWSGWRIGMESIIFVWHGLVLLGAFIHRADFKPGGSWFLAAEAAAIISLLGFYIAMERQKRNVSL